MTAWLIRNSHQDCTIFQKRIKITTQSILTGTNVKITDYFCSRARCATECQQILFIFNNGSVSVCKVVLFGCMLVIQDNFELTCCIDENRLRQMPLSHSMTDGGDTGIPVLCFIQNFQSRY